MKDIVALHRQEYGKEPDVVSSAPGTATLLGDHSNEVSGLVLCLSLGLKVEVAMSLRDDSSLRFFIPDPLERRRASLASLRYKREDRWANYIKGVLYELDRRGHPLRGLNVTVGGDLPQAIGLGASTALTVAALMAVVRLFEITCTDAACREIVSAVEADFFGKPAAYHQVLTSSTTTPQEIILVDTAQWLYRQVRSDLRDAIFLLVDARVPVEHLPEDIALRSRDCGRCLEVLSNGAEGLTLQDFTEQDLRDSMGMMSERVRRRCLHVVAENNRIREADHAFRRRDLQAVGRLMAKSHESLRDLFEVSCPEVDWLVKRSVEIDGVYGAKITGAGGCALALLERSAVDSFVAIMDDYERIFGFQPGLYAATPAEGVRL